MSLNPGIEYHLNTLLCANNSRSSSLLDALTPVVSHASTSTASASDESRSSHGSAYLEVPGLKERRGRRSRSTDSASDSKAVSIREVVDGLRGFRGVLRHCG